MLAWFCEIRIETVKKVIEYLMPKALGSLCPRFLFQGGNYGLVGPIDYLSVDCPPLTDDINSPNDDNSTISSSESSFVNSFWPKELEGELIGDKFKELNGNEGMMYGFLPKELAEPLSFVSNQRQLEGNYLWTSEQLFSKKPISMANNQFGREKLEDVNNEDADESFDISSLSRAISKRKLNNSDSKKFKAEIIIGRKCDIRSSDFSSNLLHRITSWTRASSSHDFSSTAEANQQAVKSTEEILDINNSFDPLRNQVLIENTIFEVPKMSSSLLNSSSTSISSKSEELLLNFNTIKAVPFVKTPDGISPTVSSFFKQKYVRGSWNGTVEQGNITNLSFRDVQCLPLCNVEILHIGLIDMNLKGSEISGKLPLTFRFGQTGPDQQLLCRVEGKLENNIATGTFESDILPRRSLIDSSQDVQDEKYISTYTENQEAPPKYSLMLNQFDKIIQEENEILNAVSDSQLLHDKREINKANALKVYSSSRYSPDVFQGIKYLSGEWYSDYDGRELVNLEVRDIRAVQTDLTTASLTVANLEVKSEVTDNIVSGTLLLTFICKELDNRSQTKVCIVKGVVDGTLARGTFESEPDTFHSVKHNDTMFVRTLSEMNLSPIKMKNSVNDSSIAEEENEQISKSITGAIRKIYDEMDLKEDDEKSDRIMSRRDVTTRPKQQVQLSNKGSKVSKSLSSRFKPDLRMEDSSDGNITVKSTSSAMSFKTSREDVLITGYWQFEDLNKGTIEKLRVENLKVFRCSNPIAKVKLIEYQPNIKIDGNCAKGTITLQLLIEDTEPIKTFLCDIIGVVESNGNVSGTLTNEDRINDKQMEDQYISTYTELKQVPPKLSSVDIHRNYIETIEEEND
ncbi:DgyrCDS13812 [Dimorphilus gyrociliatus]|uniref:DgyrCDS13812 n=1 Tax=Dimorphilus gyrociliatus TaxID=2664684 RepID=A0A7I8WC01_9ANNE|nr:DgyrCDS13812 [Dimorphilus gyrociliatus]